MSNLTFPQLSPTIKEQLSLPKNPRNIHCFGAEKNDCDTSNLGHYDSFFAAKGSRMTNANQLWIIVPLQLSTYLVAHKAIVTFSA